MLGSLAELPAELGKIGDLLADNGYFSEGNVNACAAAGIEPAIAMGREAHHLSLAERFAEDPMPPTDPTPVASMRHRLCRFRGARLHSRASPTRTVLFRTMPALCVPLIGSNSGSKSATLPNGASAA